VIALTLPPLRERREDIPVLAEHFLDRYAPPAEVYGWRRSFCSGFANINWPGNVRELENAIRRAIALSSGEEISADLQPGLLQAQPLRARQPGSSGFNNTRLGEFRVNDFGAALYNTDEPD